MAAPVSAPLPASPRAHRPRRWVSVTLAASAFCLGLAAHRLFVQYPTAEWHFAVVRTLTSLGVVVPILLISYLTLRASVMKAAAANRQLKEVNQVYLSTVEILANAIDSKDQVRSHDIRRVQHYASCLAREVGIDGEPELKAIEAAVLLHDMGKVSLPASILNKPGKLTPAEFDRVKQHVTVAAQILSQIDFPYPVVPVVRHHHEHWDGTGYPDGLKGEAIPLGARVMAVVDCFDALTSDRPYRPALANEDAVRVIAERRGATYDPRVVDAFVNVIARLAATEQPHETPRPEPLAWPHPAADPSEPPVDRLQTAGVGPGRCSA